MIEDKPENSQNCEPLASCFKVLRFHDPSIQLFPPFMLTQTEIERLLPVGSVEKEQAIKCLEHSYSMYDYYGNHIPHIKETENLIDEIRTRETYILDNNSIRKSEIVKHSDKAFIISATIGQENQNPKSLLFDETFYKSKNVFVIGPLVNFGRVLIERIDEAYQHVFDIKKFDEGLDKTSGLYAKDKRKNWIDNFVTKDEINTDIFVALLSPETNQCGFMQTMQAVQLPRPDTIGNVIQKFKDDIKRRLPDCKYKFNKSIVAARKCFCVSLLENKVVRNQYDDPNNANLFGDMRLLAIAIYLGAKIATEDKGLKKMAGYAEIKCDSFSQIKAGQIKNGATV